MRATDAEAVLVSLAAPDADAGQRLLALRTLKNLIIGDRRQKADFLRAGAAEAVVRALETERDAALLAQAAQAAGSLAAAPEGAARVLAAGGAAALLGALAHEEPRVAEAALRALRAVCRHRGAAPAEAICASKGSLVQLVAFAASDAGAAGEHAAGVLARCLDTPARRAQALAAGAAPALAASAASAAPRRARRDAALAALAALVDVAPGEAGAGAAAVLAAEPGIVPLLTDVARDAAAAPGARVAACVSLSHIAPLLVAGDAARGAAERAAVPALAALLDEPAPDAGAAAAALARLCGGAPALQRAAVDGDAVPRLAALAGAAAGAPPAARAAALRALALLALEEEDHRRRVAAAPGALAAVAAALTAADEPGLRAAGAACARALSRSRALLRGALGALGDAAPPLLALTDDTAPGWSLAAATEAAAALANMAVEHSALKPALLAAGGVARFAALAASPHRGLRLHGVWGLSSAAYMASEETKAAVAAALPWAAAAALLADADDAVAEKTALLCRNLVYCSAADVAAALAWSGGALLGAARAAAGRPGAPEPLRAHAVYVAVNAASGAVEHKAAVVAAGWAPALAAALSDDAERVREAAVWAVLNLAWTPEGAGAAGAPDPGAPARLEALRAAGLEARLAALEGDPCAAVRERAAKAAGLFRPLGERGAGAAPPRPRAGDAAPEGGAPPSPLHDGASSSSDDDGGGDGDGDGALGAIERAYLQTYGRFSGYGAGAFGSGGAGAGASGFPFARLAAGGRAAAAPRRRFPGFPRADSEDEVEVEDAAEGEESGEEEGEEGEEEEEEEEEGAGGYY
jgi:hypothetical protein